MTTPYHNPASVLRVPGKSLRLRIFYQFGKAIKVTGLDIFTFKDGKCVNHQHVADHLDLVMQMGLKLTPTPSDKKD
ncbi:MAG TPA: hypothetical protein VM101_07285 [Flavitalea sp.]|nr:hypothetical protein [Flavitalea sp.]